MMALSGDIASFPLAAVIRLLHGQKKTGVLLAKNAAQRVGIRFREGAIAGMDGESAGDDALARLLVKTGRVNAAQIESIRDAAPERSLAAALAAEGIVALETVRRIRQMLFREAVAQLLTWSTGRFDYTEGLADPAEDAALRIDSLHLLTEAERWSAYRRLIPDDRVVFAITPDAPRKDLAAIEGGARVMLLLDGRRSVAEIIAQSGMPKLAIYRALAALIDRGIVYRRQTPTGQTEAAPFGNTNALDDNAVIAFFTQTVRLVVVDMEAELGRRAQDAAAGVLARFPQHAPLFSHWDLRAEPRDAARRIQTHLPADGPPSRERLITAFTQVLTALLEEAGRLLGDPYRRRCAKKIETDWQSRGDRRYAPLMDRVRAAMAPR